MFRISLPQLGKVEMRQQPLQQTHAKQLLLPQNDKAGAEARSQYLQKMRKLYAYTLRYDGNIGILDTLPPQEKQGFYYQFRLLSHLAKLLPSLLNIIGAKLSKYPYQTFKNYFFFKNSPYPDRTFLNNFEDDLYFGLQRQIGMNPIVIAGLTQDHPFAPRFQVEPVTQSLPSSSYKTALTDKRLYIADYSNLEKVAENLGETDGYKKYVTAPLALFYREDDGLLRPLAIQLYANQPTSISNPIYTPADGKDWLMAKTYVQAADGTHHESWTHATRIHLMLGSIIIASHRNFTPQHPLYPLLFPHMQYTLSVNQHDLFLPTKKTKNPRFGSMFAATNQALIQYIGKGMREFDFEAMAFPNDIKHRHMEDEHLYYPYRDDGKLVWDEVHHFVREYISLYYKSDQDVLADDELQAWAQEIGGSLEVGNFGIPGFPTQLNRIEQVIEIIGNIIFIATGHHSCIHYPQYQYAGYIPNMPFSVYTPPTTDFKGSDAQTNRMKLFPPFGQAFYQMLIFYLTDFKVNRMGQYDLSTFGDRPRQIIKQHQMRLQNISQEINCRNQKRRFPYPFMDPQHIPNSVTV